MTINKLGSGVKSILGTIKDNIDSPVKELDISMMVPGPFQVRTDFNENELNNLAESIREYGVIEPIIVRKKGDIYEIIAGERRFRASKIVGLSKVPVCIKELTDKDAQFISIVENLQRSNLNVIEEAEGFNKLINNFNYKQEDIAKSIGKSRSYITNILRLLTLPAEIKKMLIDKKLSATHARALVNYPNAIELAEKIINNELTVKEVENLISDNKKKTLKIESKQKKEYLRDIGEKLSKKINLKSKVEFNRIKDHGKIIIEYNGLRELEGFMKKIY